MKKFPPSLLLRPAFGVPPEVVKGPVPDMFVVLVNISWVVGLALVAKLNPEMVAAVAVPETASRMDVSLVNVIVSNMSVEVPFCVYLIIVAGI